MDRVGSGGGTDTPVTDIATYRLNPHRGRCSDIYFFLLPNIIVFVPYKTEVVSSPSSVSLDDPPLSLSLANISHPLLTLLFLKCNKEITRLL